MYNAHRGMVQPPSSSNRLSELFDQIRREFETHAQDRAGEHDQNSEFLLFSGLIPQVRHMRLSVTSSPANSDLKNPLPSLSLSPARRSRRVTYPGTGKHGN